MKHHKKTKHQRILRWRRLCKSTKQHIKSLDKTIYQDYFWPQHVTHHCRSEALKILGLVFSWWASVAMACVLLVMQVLRWEQKSVFAPLLIICCWRCFYSCV
jgi:hypothetical protein